MWYVYVAITYTMWRQTCSKLHVGQRCFLKTFLEILIAWRVVEDQQICRYHLTNNFDILLSMSESRKCPMKSLWLIILIINNIMWYICMYVKNNKYRDISKHLWRSKWFVSLLSSFLYLAVPATACMILSFGMMVAVVSAGSETKGATFSL